MTSRGKRGQSQPASRRLRVKRTVIFKDTLTSTPQISRADLTELAVDEKSQSLVWDLASSPSKFYEGQVDPRGEADAVGAPMLSHQRVLSRPAQSSPGRETRRSDSGRQHSPADLLAAHLSDASDDAGRGKANLEGADASFRFADLSFADLEAADLSEADFRHVKFNHARLAGAVLTGGSLDYADFGGADLTNVNLSGASLRHANLSGANLAAANLSRTDLRYARLSSANLKAANLESALLDYADFTEASVAKANLFGAQLCYAKNLTPTQIAQSDVSPSTILPLHFQRQPWKQTGVKTSNLGWRLRCATVVLIGAIASLGVLCQHWHVASPHHDLQKSNVAERVSMPGERLAGIVENGREPLSDVSPATLPLPAVVWTKSSVASPVLNLVSDVSVTLPLISAASVPYNLRGITGNRLLTEAARLDRLLSPTPEDLGEIGHSSQEASVAVLRDSIPSVLRDLTPPFVSMLQGNFVLAVIDVEEKTKSVGQATTNAFGEPTTLVVSLNQQKIDVYRGMALVASSKVSSGMPGHATKPGVFSILEKQRYHHSNIYSGAPMPWMNRLTRSGTALHAGSVPGYPASHGCIRLPLAFAPKLYSITRVGDNVVVAGNQTAPKLIEHPNLFQPLPSDLAFAASTPVGSDADGDAVANQAPLRILVTHRTERDRIIAVQYLLLSMGFLTPQNFSGRLGAETVVAIKAFQKANGLPETGRFTDQLAKKVYEVARTEEPAEGRLFVRQDFRRLFDMPISFRDRNQPLGTHVFTAMSYDPSTTKI